MVFPLYGTTPFVNRDLELQAVQALIQHVYSGQMPSTRALIFRGARGSGKTWLGLHLIGTIAEHFPDTTTVFLNLYPPVEIYETKGAAWFVPHDYYTKPAEQREPVTLARTIVEWFAAHIGAPLAPAAFPLAAAQQVAAHVEQAFENRVLLLVLDSVAEADEQLIKALEDYLIGALVQVTRVVFVMTARHEATSSPWTASQLRNNVQILPLQAFDEQTTAAQIGTSDLNESRKIVELGGGHPATNYLLAQATDTEELNSASLLNTAIDALLTVVNGEDRSRVRQYLEALCPLEGIEEDLIPLMLNASVGGLPYNLRAEQVRGVRDLLLSTKLVRWNDENLLIIDDSVRRLLVNMLRLHDQERWLRLHRQAYCRYTTIAQTTRRHAVYFSRRAEPHASVLRAAGIDPTTCC